MTGYEDGIADWIYRFPLLPAIICAALPTISNARVEQQSAIGNRKSAMFLALHRGQELGV